MGEGRRIHRVEDKIRNVSEYYSGLYKSSNPLEGDITRFLDKITIPKFTMEHMRNLDKVITRQELENVFNK